MIQDYPTLDIYQLYKCFNAPVTTFDCGQLCSVHNPSGKPFCCDICHAVPAAYHQEWAFLQDRTDLWHVWRGDECLDNPEDPQDLLADTPDHMLLLACLGPDRCQRNYRALGCRQFPFFPYITANYEFIGMAYEWEFEETCWVISHLETVTTAFREQFTATFDAIFSIWGDEFESYVYRSEDMREKFTRLQRRIPLILRSGDFSLVSPVTGEIEIIPIDPSAKYGPYKA